jgi:hypothetical protein
LLTACTAQLRWSWCSMSRGILPSERLLLSEFHTRLET